MFVLIIYDVSTKTSAGKARLHRVAKICENDAQRVQNSVFEAVIDPALWVQLKQRLINACKPEEDSLRFYYLGDNWQRNVEHVGAKPSYDPTGPLII